LLLKEGKMNYRDDEDGCDLAAQADYYQTIADSQDAGRTIAKKVERIAALEADNAKLREGLKKIGDRLSVHSSVVARDCSMMAEALLKEGI
jgi:hypothetical protein